MGTWKRWKGILDAKTTKGDADRIRTVADVKNKLGREHAARNGIESVRENAKTAT